MRACLGRPSSCPARVRSLSASVLRGLARAAPAPRVALGAAETSLAAPPLPSGRASPSAASMAATAVPPPPPRFVLVSDIDGTMHDGSDPTNASLLRFNEAWRRHAPDALLVYCTGRSRASYDAFVGAGGAPLLSPDALVCSVGTELYDGPDLSLDASYAAALDAGWRRADLLSAAASVPGLELQQPSEQRPHKVSLRLRQPGAGAAADTTLGALRAALAATGAPHALIYSSSRDVDILPAGASKGAALGALLRQLAARHGVAPADVAARTMAAGDSGNDEALLGGVDGVAACVVGNAQPELAAWAASEAAAAGRRVYRARGRAAAGVLEALQHFGWMPAD